MATFAKVVTFQNCAVIDHRVSNAPNVHEKYASRGSDKYENIAGLKNRKFQGVLRGRGYQH